MNALLIRNISVTSTKLTYDLYFSYDSSYSIPVGKALGFRVHEYGSEYVVQLSGSLENAITRYAGYGNGGYTSALFITSLDPSKYELFIGSVSWTIDPNSVSQVRTDWSAVLNNFGSDEYATVAMGFSQVISYSARDVQLSSKSVFIESAINQLPLGSVSINGSPSPGEILTASNNLSDKDGVGVVTYQWQFSNEGKIWNNLGVGPSITVTDNQVAKFIRVNATYIDGKGNNELVSSIGFLKILPPAPTPTIALSANKTNLIAGDYANVTFFLSEVSTNFIVSDVIITGGSLTNFTGSGATYFAIFTPTENSNLFGTISVPDAVFTNASGKANADGLDPNNKITFGVDTVKPTIAISSNKSSLIGGDSATVTFTVNEASTNFVASDITVTGGTLSNFSGSGTSYTATLTPTVNSTTSGTVSVASGVFSDAAGNINADGSDANNTITLAVDTVVPTIALSSIKTNLIAGDTTTLIFTLSEASTTFTASDVTVTGGALSNFTGSGRSYSALFTPIANNTTNGTISVASGAFTDVAGNVNADGSDANNLLILAVDTLLPTIAVSSNKSSLQGGDSATLTFTVSEASTNFVAADVLVSGGTLSNFTGSGTSYTATFKLVSNSALIGTVNIANGVFTDAAGNKNADGSDANNSVNFARIPTITNEIHTLSVIVDKNVLGASATLLKEIKESITLTNGAITKHIVEYSGLTYDYSQIDLLITTVTRDDEFTVEFTKEINDYLNYELNIPFAVAVKLVGAASIDAILLSVAGADGSFIA
jgi:hypothetical protein